MFLLQERQVGEESNVQQNIVPNSMPTFNHPPPPFMVPPMMMMMRAPPPGMDFQPPPLRPPVLNAPLLTNPPGTDKPQVHVQWTCSSCIMVILLVCGHNILMIHFLLYSRWKWLKWNRRRNPRVPVPCQMSPFQAVPGLWYGQLTSDPFSSTWHHVPLCGHCPKTWRGIPTFLR